MIKKKIISGTSINTVGKALSYSLQLFIITYLIKTLGKETYGVVVLAFSLVANTNLLEAGFGLSVTKYVAEYKTKEDWKKLLEIINTNFIVSVVLALIFSVILLIINEFFLDKIFLVPLHLLKETKVLIRILIALSIIEFFSVNIVRVAEGLQKYAIARSMEVLKWALRAAFILIAVGKGYGLIGVGIAYFCAGIISLIAFYILVFLRDPNLRLSPNLGTIEAFKHLFGFSIWIFFSKVFSFLSYRIDTILIGIFLSPVYLTYYNIAFKIYEFLRFGFSLLASTLVPVASEIIALKDYKKLSLLFQKATKYTVIIFYPVLIIFFLYSDKIINLWVGHGFDDSIILSRLFILSLFFTALVSTGAEMMIGMNKQRDLVFYAGVATLVNFVVSIILIRKIGAEGVVIGTLIGSIVIATGYLWRMFTIFEISFIEFLREMVGKPLAGSLFLWVILYFFIDKLYAGIAAILLYFVLAVTSLLDIDDRKDFLKFFKTKSMR